MNGIEKISARILADAETEAAAIRAQAEEKAAQIRTDYDRRIESEQQRLTAEAQAEAEKQLPAGRAAASLAPRSRVYQALCAACRAGKRNRVRSADLLRSRPQAGGAGRNGAGECAASKGREARGTDAFRRNAADVRRRCAEGRAD